MLMLLMQKIVVKIFFKTQAETGIRILNKMESVLNRVNPAWTYMMGSAVHIDVIACATQERWGKLNRENPSALKEIIFNCREHFSRAISNLPDGTIILCDGPRALAELASIGFRFDMQPSQPFNIMEDIGRIGELACGTKKYSVRGWSCQVNYLTAFWRFDLAMWIQGTFAF